MRWRALALSVLGALCGCRSGSLEGGRYACDPRLAKPIDGKPQCPDEWRCGLEGYCHPRGDTSVPWRCEVEGDCESGWTCGLAASRDHRECHDPGSPDAGYACEAETDCVAGWHCGVARTCYSRADKKPFRCAGDGDCADGWRCGLEALCHDSAVGSAYACRTDAGAEDGFCEQGWRCGVDGVCIDPGQDALMPDAPLAIDGGELLNPLLISSPPTHFSASSPLAGPPGRDRRLLTYVSGGELYLVDQYVGTEFRFGQNPHRYFNAGDAGQVVALAAYGHESFDIIGFQDFVDVHDPRVYLLRPDGGIGEVTFRANGAASWREGLKYYDGAGTTVAVDRLKVSDARPSDSPMGLAFSSVPSDKYLRFDSASAFVEDDLYVDSYWPDFQSVANNRIYDMASVRPGVTHTCVFAADNRGLWISQAFAPGGTYFYFEPVNIPPFFTNAICGAPQYRLVALNLKGREWLAVTALALDGGSPAGRSAEVALLDLRALWPEGDAGIPLMACTSPGPNCSSVPGETLPFRVAIGPCQACPSGSPLSVNPVVQPDGEGAIEARCPSPADAGQAEQTFLITSGKSAFSGSCLRAPAVGESSLLSDAVVARPANDGLLAFAGARGQLWSGETSAEALSLTLDRAPIAMARFKPAAGPATAVAFTEQLMAWPIPGVGFLVNGFQRGDPGRPVASVQGHPEWFVLKSKQLLDLSDVDSSGPRTIGYVGSSSAQLLGPYTALTAPTSSGGTALMVSSHDTLFEADVTQLLSGSGPAVTLAPRITPQPGLPVGSVAAIAPRPLPSGELPRLQAYALVGSRVFELTSDSAHRWRQSELSLPGGLTPVEVLSDRGRARVGFTDGTLYALPARVRVAEPMGLSERPAVDFATACGAVFALGDRGLLKLGHRPGSPVAGWTGIELGGAMQGRRFTGGRLHALGAELFLFTSSGEAVRVKLAECQE